MKFLRGLLQVVIHVILAVIALNALAANMWRFSSDPLRNFLARHGVTAEVLYNDTNLRIYWLIVLLLIVLYWIVMIAIWRRKPRALQVRTSSGEVLMIHPGALLKFARLQVENHPAVVSQRVRIRQKGNRGLSIWVWVNVQPLESLPTIKRQIEDSIRDGFAQVLGIEKIDDVSIVLGLDEKNLNVRPGAAGAAEPKPEPPVRGTLAEPAAATAAAAAPASWEPPTSEREPESLTWHAGEEAPPRRDDYAEGEKP